MWQKKWALLQVWLEEMFEVRPYGTVIVIAFLITSLLIGLTMILDSLITTSFELKGVSRSMGMQVKSAEEVELLQAFLRGKECVVRKIDVVGERVEVVLRCREAE